MTTVIRNLYCPVCHERGEHVVDYERQEATCRNLGCTRPWNFLDKLDLGIKPKPEMVIMTHGGPERHLG